MPQIPFEKGKLIPLRRFAVESLYSVAYLSQIVQRKKLKAQKIGRNYFTKPEWFEEYLVLHARDDVRRAYRDYFTAKVELSVKPKARKSEKEDNKLFNSFKLKYSAIFVAVFILLISVFAIIFMQMNDNGMVAGDEENGTSTFIQIRVDK